MKYLIIIIATILLYRLFIIIFAKLVYKKVDTNNYDSLMYTVLVEKAKARVSGKYKKIYNLFMASKIIVREFIKNYKIKK